jgi:hypothetical protein
MAGGDDDDDDGACWMGDDVFLCFNSTSQVNIHMRDYFSVPLFGFVIQGIPLWQAQNQAHLNTRGLEA